MKYRSRTEIAEMILRAANQGATKTRIMYAAYLSYTQVQEYLKYLQERELLVYDTEKSVYKLTEKGLQFLHACEQVNGMMMDTQPKAEESGIPAK